MSKYGTEAVLIMINKLKTKENKLFSCRSMKDYKAVCCQIATKGI
mgnify:CR=1 FL=1